MSKTEISPELGTQIREYLEQQGYEVTEEAKLPGKSGIEHTFDMLAERDDGFTSHTIAIGIAASSDREAEMDTIFHFANKAYDCGILDRILVTSYKLSQQTKQLAGKQRIQIIEGEQIARLLTRKLARRVRPVEAVKFETKGDLVAILTSRGYVVEENPKVKGKSGVEYTFDILAHIEHGQVEHRLGIDFLNGDKEVSLEQVMLFDTKAYEVGVDEKFIVISGELGLEAQQFVRQQRIKVLEPGQEPAPETVTEELPARGAEKPAKIEEPSTKLLRQRPQPEALQLIPEVVARRYNAIPLTISNRTLEVAMADPTDVFALEAFAAHSRMRVKPIAASAKDVRDAIDFNYKAYSEIEQQISRMATPVEETYDRIALTDTTDTPLVQALTLIIEEAVKARASDIHIEPQEDRVRIRYRIDGTLHDMMSVPVSSHRPLVSRVKILGGMNIADHFRPQDGQF